MMFRDMTKFPEKWEHALVSGILSVPEEGSVSNCLSVVSCHNFYENRFFRKAS
jgi:hypothetical protein